MNSILAAIQAGGRSARMGTDKAWVTLHGRPLIEYVLNAAQPLAKRLAIVISQDMPHQQRYEQLAAQWQAKLLFDPNEHLGPLGGIQTALRDCAPDETALILACDLPFLTTEFLRILAQLHREHSATITVPLDQTGRRQMLAGLYAPAGLTAIEELLAENKLRVDGLCQRVTIQEISFPSYAHLAHAATLLDNLNSVIDVQTAEINNPLRHSS